MKYLFAFLLIFVSYSMLSQDLQYVKEQAKILSADNMRGRGYVKNGLNKAAKHIVKQYKEIGLTSFGDDFYQYFSHPVNSFPKKIVLKVNVFFDRKCGCSERFGFTE